MLTFIQETWTCSQRYTPTSNSHQESYSEYLMFQMFYWHPVSRQDILWCCLRKSKCPKSTGDVGDAVVIDRDRLAKTGGCNAIDCPSDPTARCVVTRGRTLCVPFSTSVELSSQHLFVEERRECCEDHTGYTYSMEFDVCYKMYTHTKRFTEGRRVCKEHRGDLAMPKTVELQAFYVDHVLSKSSVNAFLGAMRIVCQWRWLDNTFVKGIRFKRHDCVTKLCLLYNRDDNALTNGKCKHSYNLGFLCEIPMNV
ncbi:uncharacterized protein LOC124263875 [Haliotis rubra]|uniref:uncharacterized protein LOC124263875 n=1 Tax=Haliotis rubra TaxID=36100 RepID=UPI001EE62008|nr:uncharacterized protein LOC124263875 [Haliotis rubra]